MNCAALLALLCQMLGVGLQRLKPSNIRREEGFAHLSPAIFSSYDGHKRL